MKLLARKINNQTIGIDIKTWNANEVNFITSQMVLENYTDITSILNWDEFGLLTNKDYKFVRQELINLFLERLPQLNPDYSNLTTVYTIPELIILSKWFAVPPEIRILFFTLEQLDQLSEEFNDNMREARQNRFDKACLQIYNRLPNDFRPIIQEIEVDGISNRFILYGDSSNAEGDLGKCIYDYVLSTPGTPYEGVGFSSKLLTPLEYNTMPNFAIKIIDILKNGNY